MINHYDRVLRFLREAKILIYACLSPNFCRHLCRDLLRDAALSAIDVVLSKFISVPQTEIEEQKNHRILKFNMIWNIFGMRGSPRSVS